LNGEEVARRDEAIHCAEVDVIGINVEAMCPAERHSRSLRLGKHSRRLRAYEGVLTIGFVPDGCDVDAECTRTRDGLVLGLALMERIRWRQTSPPRACGSG
jgi:hypothetical protein